MLYQLSTVTPLGDVQIVGSKLLYENDEVVCWYDYWAPGGSTAVEFQNKTDQDMILSLPHCNYTLNDVHFPFYSKARERQAYDKVGKKIESNDQQVDDEEDLVPAYWQVTDTSISAVDPKLILIPAHGTISVEGYMVNPLYFDEAGLRAKPKGGKGKSLTFTREDSPFVWENELVYFKPGRDTVNRVRHQFYVSQVANMKAEELYQKVYSNDAQGQVDSTNFTYLCPFATPNRFYVQYNPDDMPRNYSVRGVLYLGGLFLVMSLLLVTIDQ